MLRYLKETHLKDEFEKYLLDQKDLTFIEELIDPKKRTDEEDWPHEGRKENKSYLYEVRAILFHF